MSIMKMQGIFYIPAFLVVFHREGPYAGEKSCLCWAIPLEELGKFEASLERITRIKVDKFVRDLVPDVCSLLDLEPATDVHISNSNMWEMKKLLVDTDEMIRHCIDRRTDLASLQVVDHMPSFLISIKVKCERAEALAFLEHVGGGLEYYLQGFHLEDEKYYLKGFHWENEICVYH